MQWSISQMKRDNKSQALRFGFLKNDRLYLIPGKNDW